MRSEKTLTPARLKLTRLMQEINFGSIYELVIQRGQPVFEPPPRVVRLVKLDGTNGPRGELSRSDFVMKAALLELFHNLDHVDDGARVSLEVKHGLPFLMRLDHKL